MSPGARAPGLFLFMNADLEKLIVLQRLDSAANDAQRRLADDLRSEIRATHALAEHHEALTRARGGTSDGKVLFVPS